MKNRNVGFLILGISVMILVLVLIFDSSMRATIASSCTHGPSCSMYTAVNTQTYIALAVAGMVFIIGLFFVLVKEPIQIRTIRERQKKINYSKLNLDKKEKQVISILQKENSMFQADLLEKLSIGKVGLTRLLDKLEAKQLIERKRRGMNNIIVLK